MLAPKPKLCDHGALKWFDPVVDEKYTKVKPY